MCAHFAGSIPVTKAVASQLIALLTRTKTWRRKREWQSGKTDIFKLFTMEWLEVEKELSIMGDLVLTIEKYNQLLVDECSELAGMAAVHGWKSKRVEEGAAFREKIAELKSFLQ